MSAGYDADLVLLRGDPATDVANFAAVEGVIKEGVLGGTRDLENLTVKCSRENKGKGAWFVG